MTVALEAILEIKGLLNVTRESLWVNHLDSMIVQNRTDDMCQTDILDEGTWSVH